MSLENPLLGAPRIHGELLKLGIDIGETSVGKYMARGRKPPSRTSRTFLENHFQSMVSVDFFTVPTIRFQVLYVFLALAQNRHRILHFAVTPHPTAEWTRSNCGRRFPGESAPRFLLRDRDRNLRFWLLEPGGGIRDSGNVGSARSAAAGVRTSSG
jgi:hypothetical protein